MEEGFFWLTVPKGKDSIVARGIRAGEGPERSFNRNPEQTERIRRKVRLCTLKAHPQ